MPSLGMANEHVMSARVASHRRRDLPGGCALVFPVDVLDANSDVQAILQRFDDRRERDRGRKEDDLSVGMAWIVLQKGTKELTGIRRPMIHLPVCREDASRHVLFVVEGSDAWEHLALEEFERCATAGGHVRHR